MPTYQYECDKCDLEKEIIKPMSESADIEICDQCNNPMRRIYSSNIQFVGAKVKDAEYYHSFGEVVKSDNHRKELMKKHNVIEVGSETPKNIKKYTERHRLERLKKDYED